MQKTVLKIEGMGCGMCEAHINDRIRQCFLVKKVSASYRSGECEIVSENLLDPEKLKSAIAETGYTVLSVTQTAYEKKKFSFFGR